MIRKTFEKTEFIAIHPLTRLVRTGIHFKSKFKPASSIINNASGAWYKLHGVNSLNFHEKKLSHYLSKWLHN